MLNIECKSVAHHPCYYTGGYIVCCMTRVHLFHTCRGNSRVFLRFLETIHIQIEILLIRNQSPKILQPPLYMVMAIA